MTTLRFNTLRKTTETVVSNKENLTQEVKGMASVTIRIDADCYLLCDGEYIEDIEIKANKLIKIKLPIGQHLLEFVDLENPNVKVEKVVDFPESGKSYLVLIDGLEEAIIEANLKKSELEAKQIAKSKELEAQRKKEEAELQKKLEEERKAKEIAELNARRLAENKARKDITYTILIGDVKNMLQAIMTARVLFGWGTAEAKTNFANLPLEVFTTKSFTEVSQVLQKLDNGGIVADVLAVNALGEVVEIEKNVLEKKNKIDIITAEKESKASEKAESKSKIEYAQNINTKYHEIKEDFVFNVKGVCFTMKFVEGGTFMMGATATDDDALEDEKPLHKVKLDSYYISETQVTQEQWEAVMDNNPSEFRGTKLPVETVSWYDCQEFIGKLNHITGKEFSLPTEAQWEYAARGGNKSKGYKFSGGNRIGEVAWFGRNCDETRPVATKRANELGLYDMTGNVSEWCNDWYKENYYADSPLENPQGPSSGTRRVLRGGSWYYRSKFNRLSYRNPCDPSRGSKLRGLRLVIQL